MTAPEKPSNDDTIQSPGRDANAAQPLNVADDNAGARRYPSAGRDDSVDAPDAPAPEDRR